MPKSIIRLSSSVEKNLHSSCTGQKWLIFLNKNNDLLVADIMVGMTMNGRAVFGRYPTFVAAG